MQFQNAGIQKRFDELLRIFREHHYEIVEIHRKHDIDPRHSDDHKGWAQILKHEQAMGAIRQELRSLYDKAHPLETELNRIETDVHKREKEFWSSSDLATQRTAFADIMKLLDKRERVISDIEKSNDSSDAPD